MFKGTAAKGKTSTGWFFGLKIHLVINNLGEIVPFDLTPGNVGDNNHNLLRKLLSPLEGRCVVIWLPHGAFQLLLPKGAAPGNESKEEHEALPVENELNLFISKRAVIESVFDILGTVYDIEHSHHRSPLNASVHIFSALIAYQHLEENHGCSSPSKSKNLKIAA